MSKRCHGVMAVIKGLGFSLLMFIVLKIVFGVQLSKNCPGVLAPVKGLGFIGFSLLTKI